MLFKPGNSIGEGVEMVSKISTDIMPSDARMDYIGDTNVFN